MYDQQVLSYLSSINNKVGSIDNNVLNTKVSNDKILYQTQQLVSGDILINQRLDSMDQNMSVLCVFVCIFFLWSCLFTFLRK